LPVLFPVLEQQTKNKLEGNFCYPFLSGECRFGDSCKFAHDLEGYLKIKGDEISSDCVIFNKTGHCPYGIRCLFSSGHHSSTPTQTENPPSQSIVLNEESDQISLLGTYKILPQKNALDKAQKNILRRRHYLFETSASVSKLLEKNNVESLDQLLGLTNESELPKFENRAKKKTVDFQNKLILAPLTTTGNMPFRRICKHFGADITIGEMAMAKALVKGQSREWPLLRRHPVEDIFGIQLCGSHHNLMGQCVEMIDKLDLDIDFIDLNVGCPIDYICRKGGGSSLLDRPKRLKDIILAMSACTDIPITVKARMGVSMGKSTLLETIPIIAKSGASALTIHGRSSEISI